MNAIIREAAAKLLLSQHLSSFYACGVMDLRIPLISSYSAKQEKSGLSPQAAGAGDLGGRPRTDDVWTEGKEQDLDDGK